MQTILSSGGSISIELAKSLKKFTDDISSTEIIFSTAGSLKVIVNTHQPGIPSALMS
jgi:hypothetical protein